MKCSVLPSMPRSTLGFKRLISFCGTRNNTLINATKNNGFTSNIIPVVGVSPHFPKYSVERYPLSNLWVLLYMEKKFRHIACQIFNTFLCPSTTSRGRWQSTNISIIFKIVYFNYVREGIYG